MFYACVLVATLVGVALQVWPLRLLQMSSDTGPPRASHRHDPALGRASGGRSVY